MRHLWRRRRGRRMRGYDMRRMVVMSALGTKQYYARLGYEKQGVYVSKPL